MARIAGVELPKGKRVDIALTRIYGVGRSNVATILSAAKVVGDKRVEELSEEEIGRLQKAVEAWKVEGDLRAQISQNIKTLKEISAYRGLRHGRNLPVRGQRTKSNARTKRGKRVTIGAIKKELADKMAAKTAAAPEASQK